mmetsp:Transcript_25631/g.84380  ORF Transcript_25631/g.84380 Transcript_25631/m.84380 type:complete len:544 (-) Transcript_25631:102-1733(-)
MFKALGFGVTLASLISASKSGDEKEVERVLKAKPALANERDEEGRTALLYASGEGKTNIVLALLSAGADKDTRDNDGLTAMHVCAIMGRLETFRALVKAGASLEDKTNTGERPLHLAVKRKQTKIVEMLLAAKASPEALTIDKKTPLHVAAREGNSPAAALLLSSGANLEATDKNGRTPLHHAANEGHSGLVAMFLERKAQLDAQDLAFKRTPLHLAANCGKSETVKALLKQGATSDIKDKDGNTAFDLAQKAGHTAVSELLQAQQTPHRQKSASQSSTAAGAAHASNSDGAVELWDIAQVTAFLEQIGLGVKSADFVNAAVNGQILATLTDDDLKQELGLSGLQTRRLRQELDALNAQASIGANQLARAGSGGQQAYEYHCFLTHDWGVDTVGRNNHDRVIRVNDGLKRRGLVTWVDEERMEGNIMDQMWRGIKASGTVVVFITSRYIDKVGGDNPNDNCKLEFEYARTKRGKFLVPVPMEPETLNPSDWDGPVSMVLGSLLYRASFPTDDEDAFEAQLDALASEIRAKCDVQGIHLSPKPS